MGERGAGESKQLPGVQAAREQPMYRRNKASKEPREQGSLGKQASDPRRWPLHSVPAAGPHRQNHCVAEHLYQLLVHTAHVPRPEEPYVARPIVLDGQKLLRAQHRGPCSKSQPSQVVLRKLPSHLLPWMLLLLLALLSEYQNSAPTEEASSHPSTLLRTAPAEAHPSDPTQPSTVSKACKLDS